jgi:hypothetical protein
MFAPLAAIIRHNSALNLSRQKSIDLWGHSHQLLQRA